MLRVQLGWTLKGAEMPRVQLGWTLKGAETPGMSLEGEEMLWMKMAGIERCPKTLDTTLAMTTEKMTTREVSGEGEKTQLRQKGHTGHHQSLQKWEGHTHRRTPRHQSHHQSLQET